MPEGVWGLASCGKLPCEQMPCGSCSVGLRLAALAMSVMTAVFVVRLGDGLAW